MRTLPLLLATLLALPSCAVDDGVLTDEVESDGDDGKADTANELAVRAGETSLWVNKAITRDTREGADGLVLRGRTSRNLTDGMGFVFDDPYGAFAIRTARTFEVRWTTTELSSLMIGVDQFISLQFVHSSSRPDSLTARAVARAKMTAFSGTGSYLFSDVAPIVSGGRTVMRIYGSTTSNLISATAEIGADPYAVTITDPRHYQIDLPMDAAIDLVGSSRELAVSARTASGTRIKRAKMVLTVQKLGVTTGDAYEVWPRGECADDVRACLATNPSDTCGEALEVLACGGATAAITVTDADTTAARAAAEPALATLHTDGALLVGAARADALLTGAAYLLNARLDELVGTVYPTAAERDAALAAATTAAIDEAYAFPLALVPALTPIANDPIRAGGIAADALLLHLAGMDLVATEWARPYVQLVHQFRAQHLASLGGLRNHGVPEAHVGWPPYLFIGNWLGAHVEISVAQGSGVATNVHFEID